MVGAVICIPVVIVLLNRLLMDIGEERVLPHIGWVTHDVLAADVTVHIASISHSTAGVVLARRHESAYHTPPLPFAQIRPQVVGGLVDLVEFVLFYLSSDFSIVDETLGVVGIARW